MPQIPQYLARETLPTTPGMRGGGAQVPTILQPGVQDQGPSAIERSLGPLAQDVQQTGSLVAQTEELQARRRKAQDTLDATQTLQETRMEFQSLFERLKQGPYQTFTEEFGKQAREVMAQRGEALTPEARAIFTAKATEAMVPLHAATLQEATQRRESATTMAVMTEIQQFQDQYHRATNEFERAYHRESLQSLVSAFVDDGLMKGEHGAKILAETEKSITLEQAQIDVRADPGKAMQSIQNLMNQGKPEPGTVWERVSPAMLPSLFDEAVQQLGRKVSLTNTEEQSQRRKLQEAQSMTAGSYRAKLSDLTMSIPALVQLVKPINDDFKTQRIGEVDHAQLLGQVETRINKLQDDAFKDKDNSALAKEGTIRIQTAQTPAQLDQAEQWVKDNEKQLSSATVGQMFTRINQFRDKNDPINNDFAKAAIKTFLGGAFPGGVIPAMMDKITGEVQAKTSRGIEILNKQFREMYETQGKTKMEQQAEGIAMSLKDLYFPESATQTAALPPSLPPSFQGIKYYEDGIEVLDAIRPGMPQEAIRRIYSDLKGLPRRPANIGRPDEPGLSKVPGVKAPKKPYAPMEQR